MSVNLTHTQIEEMLGTYAVDAVDDDEREAIERHLAGCPRCRAEVADHREVAAYLGHSGAPAPEGLWDRILSSLEEAPPVPQLSVAPWPADRREGPPVGRRPDLRQPGARRAMAAAVGVAAALVIGVLGVQVVRQEHRIDRLGNGDDVASAIADPASASASLRSPDGRVELLAVLLPDGDGFLVPHELPRLRAGRTYQLWGRSGSHLISLGIMGDSDRLVHFHAEAPLTSVLLTEERSPGVAVSHQVPLVSGQLS